MKKKYIISLVVIGVMFLGVLTIGTGYGLWISTKDTTEKDATTLNCFKVYFSNGETIEMSNINSIVNEEGVETSPYTLTITNICEEKKELQVRLNVLNESTIDTNALTIEAAGNIEKDTILYKNLSNAKTDDEKVAQSKIIGLIEISPNETVRTNIKLWFDERKAPNIKKEDIFKAKFELIDTESSIKATFAEQLLNNAATIEAKGTPNFKQGSYQAEGLYVTNTNEGKTYYYRGVVNNNYVRFANLTWRVVGINPDNSIKLILDKSAGYQKFSDKVDAIDYTGLKYIYNAETINNNINDFLLQWYQANIINKELDKFVTASTFCNDSKYSVQNYHTYFDGYTRVAESNPTLNCSTTNADFGGSYNQKIGLITADEIIMAGGLYNKNNLNYYLYNGENFFTQTPAEYFNYNSYMFYVTNTGSILKTRPDTELGIRPVINLQSTITVSGSGTQTDPYTIDMN